MDAEKRGRWRHWAIVAVAALVTLSIILLAGLALFDWNAARGWISAKVLEKTGRELAIGRLEVQPFSLHPRVRASEVMLSNAAWGDRAPLFRSDTVEFSVSLLPLFSGRVVMPQVMLGNAAVFLQRDAEGRRNWVLSPEDEKLKEARPAEIRVLTVNRGELSVKDAPTATDIAADLQSTQDPAWGIEFAVKGRIGGLAFNGKGAGGGLLSLRDTDAPYPLRFTATVGGAHASFEGAVRGLVTLSAVDGRFELSGRDLALLADTLGLSFPHTAPYKVTGRLTRQGEVWSYGGFRGTVGGSDLGGILTADMAGKRPRLKGKLASRQLDIADLGGLVGARPGEPDRKPAGKVLPSEPINLEKLRRIDADVSLTAARFRNRDKLPLDDLKMTILLEDGVMKADPLIFGVAGGSMNSRVNVDARKGGALAVDFDTAFRSVHINKLVPSTDLLDESFGAINGKVRLRGRGNSMAGVLATSSGRIDLVSRGGEVSNLLMEYAGADVGEIIKFFVGGDKTIQLRCGVAAFNVKDGIMASEVAIVDTDDTYIGGEGVINLRDETLDMKLTPLPKDVSILSLRGPLRLRGSFEDPEFGLEKRALARRVGAAALLALIHPLAALIPTIETAPGKDKAAPCADLIASLEKNIKGGTARPVGNPDPVTK